MLGNIEWEDKKKQRCFVMWRTPDEWAALIFKWVKKICVIFFSPALHVVQLYNLCTMELNLNL